VAVSADTFANVAGGIASLALAVAVLTFAGCWAWRELTAGRARLVAAWEKGWEAGYDDRGDVGVPNWEATANPYERGLP
jgi:hypothetical protein